MPLTACSPRSTSRRRATACTCSATSSTAAPTALGVLERLVALGDAATCLLGNHDLHLLAVAAGVRHAASQRHAASGAGRTRSAMRGCTGCARAAWPTRAHGWLLVHAGVLPQWSTEQTLALADEVQACCAASELDTFLPRMYGNTPARWDDTLQGADRWRVIINALTRLRFCTRRRHDGFQPSRTAPPRRRRAMRRGSTSPRAAPRARRSPSATGRRSGCSSGPTCCRSTPAACGAAPERGAHRRRPARILPGALQAALTASQRPAPPRTLRSRPHRVPRASIDVSGLNGKQVRGSCAVRAATKPALPPHRLVGWDVPHTSLKWPNATADLTVRGKAATEARRSAPAHEPGYRPAALAATPALGVVLPVCAACGDAGCGSLVSEPYPRRSRRAARGRPCRCSRRRCRAVARAAPNRSPSVVVTAIARAANRRQRDRRPGRDRRRTDRARRPDRPGRAAAAPCRRRAQRQRRRPAR